MTFSQAPNFDGLADLGRKDGIDIRPVLVRVLTDLYVQKPVHTTDEEQNYVELMLRFMDMTDIPTRANVARKLATYEQAPLPVLQRLARDVIEVAEPVLQHSSRLGPADLVAVADCSPRHGAIVTARRHFEIAGHPERARPVKDLPSAGPLLAAASPPPARPIEAAPNAAVALQPCEPIASPVEPLQPPDPAELSRRFFAADSAERRRILSHLENARDEPALDRLARDEILRRLETWALQRKPEDFVLELEGALCVSRTMAAHIVQDEHGEPLLVALKALGMPNTMLLRVLLFLNPTIGQSVERVFDLARLYEGIGAYAALRLLKSMRASHPAERAPARYQPLLAPDAPARARESLTPASRRILGRPAETAPNSDRIRR